MICSFELMASNAGLQASAKGAAEIARKYFPTLECKWGDAGLDDIIQDNSILGVAVVLAGQVQVSNCQFVYRLQTWDCYSCSCNLILLYIYIFWWKSKGKRHIHYTFIIYFNFYIVYIGTFCAVLFIWVMPCRLICH